MVPRMVSFHHFLRPRPWRRSGHAWRPLALKTEQECRDALFNLLRDALPEEATVEKEEYRSPRND